MVGHGGVRLGAAGSCERRLPNKQSGCFAAVQFVLVRKLSNRAGQWNVDSDWSWRLDRGVHGHWRQHRVGYNTTISGVPNASSYLIGPYTCNGFNGYKIALSNLHDNYNYSINGYHRTNSGALGVFYPTTTNVTDTICMNNWDMRTRTMVRCRY
jgi:hypothetical protein